MLFEKNAHQTSYNRCFRLTVEIKDCNVLINGKHFSDQPIKSDKRTYDNIRKVVTGQGDDYRTDCLLDYVYFRNYYTFFSYKQPGC